MSKDQCIDDKNSVEECVCVCVLTLTKIEFTFQHSNFLVADNRINCQWIVSKSDIKWAKKHEFLAKAKKEEIKILYESDLGEWRVKTKGANNEHDTAGAKYLSYLCVSKWMIFAWREI